MYLIRGSKAPMTSLFLAGGLWCILWPIMTLFVPGELLKNGKVSQYRYTGWVGFPLHKY